jgi:hypothetical protein
MTRVIPDARSAIENPGANASTLWRGGLSCRHRNIVHVGLDSRFRGNDKRRG